MLHALAEPTRLAILDLLDRNGETACAEAYGALGLSKANSSHHFRILREAGAIRVTMRGRDLYTRIRAEDLDGLVRIAFPACGFPVTGEFIQRQRTQRSTPPWRRCAKLALCFWK